MQCLYWAYMMLRGTTVSAHTRILDFGGRIHAMEWGVCAQGLRSGYSDALWFCLYRVKFLDFFERNSPFSVHTWHVARSASWCSVMMRAMIHVMTRVMSASWRCANTKGWVLFEKIKKFFWPDTDRIHMPPLNQIIRQNKRHEAC
jgi:hypothetical protein